MDDIHNSIENSRIRTICGSNETNGVYLKVKYELQEDGSEVGSPMEFYTGEEYEGIGIKIKIEREKMKVLMRKYKVPDDVVEKLFGAETTLAETDNDGALTTTEDTFTDENASTPRSASSGTISIATDNSEAVSTGEAALADDLTGSQEDEDKETTVADQEVIGEKKKSKKNRTKQQKAKAKAMQLVDAATHGDCLFCGELARKICAKCQKDSNQISYYCAKQCRVEHSSVHKQICSLQIPQLMYSNSALIYYAGQDRSVYGIFLPEKSAKPSIVDVRIQSGWNSQLKIFFSADSKQYLGETGCSSYILKNTLKPNRAVPNLFNVFYLPDKFLTADSQNNECVNVITGGVVADVWIGPLLVVKSQTNDWTNFTPINVNLNDDFIDIIDYFKTQQHFHIASY